MIIPNDNTTPSEYEGYPSDYCPTPQDQLETIILYAYEGYTFEHCDKYGACLYHTLILTLTPLPDAMQPGPESPFWDAYDKWLDLDAEDRELTISHLIEPK